MGANGMSYTIQFGESSLLTIEKNKKEKLTMKVSYNGFTGELVKLEGLKCSTLNGSYIYDISIYDDEKRVTYSFTSVKLEDLKFLNGEVTFS